MWDAYRPLVIVPSSRIPLLLASPLSPRHLFHAVPSLSRSCIVSLIGQGGDVTWGVNVVLDAAVVEVVWSGWRGVDIDMVLINKGGWSTWRQCAVVEMVL